MHPFNKIGARFIPLVMESYGAMTRTVVNLARRIAEYGRNLIAPKALSAITDWRSVFSAFLISSSFTAALAGGQEGPEIASVP